MAGWESFPLDCVTACLPLAPVVMNGLLRKMAAMGVFDAVPAAQVLIADAAFGDRAGRLPANVPGGPRRWFGQSAR